MKKAEIKGVGDYQKDIKSETVGELKKRVFPMMTYVLSHRSRALFQLEKRLVKNPLEVKEHKAFFDYFQAYHFAMKAFVAAVEIALLRYGRRYNARGIPGIFINEALIVRKCLRKLLVLIEKKPFVEIEKYLRDENSNTRFGNIAGFCAFDAAFQFSKMTYDYIKQGQEESRSGQKTLNSIVAFPEPEICLFRWMKITVLNIREELPPISDWPEWQMEAEKNSVTMKMYAELANIENACLDSENKDDKVENLLSSDVAQAIVKVLGTEKLKRVQIVCKTIYEDGGHLGGTLSRLKRMGVLQHKQPYYWVNPEWYERLGICPDKDRQ